MTHYQEVQQFRQPWLWVVLLAPLVYLLYWLCRLFVLDQPSDGQPQPGGGLLWAAAVAALIPLWLYKARLITEVREQELFVHFFLLWRPRRIPLSEIVRATPTTYHPIGDYGGWGVRRGRQGMAYTVSGNRGVEVELADGERLLIGSQAPEDLARAIEERVQLWR